MTQALRKLRAWGNEPSETKKKWVVAVNLALVILYIGGGISIFRYLDDKGYNDCVRRAESRLLVRGMFITTFNAIEETAGESAAITEARVQLDEQYPPLSLADC